MDNVWTTVANEAKLVVDRLRAWNIKDGSGNWRNINEVESGNRYHYLEKEASIGRKQNVKQGQMRSYL